MEYLVISAVGPQQQHSISELSLLAARSDCNIENSRICKLGAEVAVIMLVSGNWNTIAKMEAGLSLLQEQLGLAILTKRTKMPTPSEDQLPYLVQIIALDHPGIVYEVASFFSRQSIQIEDLTTSSYAASLTGTPMFSLMMRIGIPADMSIADLREQFALMCDDLNLDGMLEPERR